VTRALAVGFFVAAVGVSPCRADEADGAPAPAATASADSPAPDPWIDKVWAVVHASRKDDSDSAVASRIGALGPHAIPAVFAIYRTIDGDFRSPVKRTTLLASFREFGAADVLQYLRTTIDEKTPRDALIEALQVVGAVGGMGATKTALAAAVRIPSSEMRSPALGAVVRATTTSTLRADPEGWAELRLAWPALDPALRKVVLDGVEDTRSTDGTKFLAGLLAKDPAQNFDALRRMCRMPRLSARPLDADGVQKVRWLTKDFEPSVRAAAVLWLGLVHDSSAFGLALAMLDDPTSDVRDVALATLRRTSGAALSGDPEAWTQWRLADDAWREKGFERDLRLLDSKDANVVAETLKSLGARRLHAKDLAHPIALFATSPDASLRLAACEALGALEDVATAPQLLAALSDEDPRVVQSAGAALVAITGLRLPAESAAWRAELR